MLVLDIVNFGLSTFIALPLHYFHLCTQIFEVLTEEKPQNIAYSTDQLHLHMDLTFYESVPGLQLLHCIRLLHHSVCTTCNYRIPQSLNPLHIIYADSGVALT